MLKALIEKLTPPTPVIGGSLIGGSHGMGTMSERDIRRREFMAAAHRLPEGDEWKEKVMAQLGVEGTVRT